MKIIKNQITRTITVINGQALEAEELMEELQDAFKAVNDAYILEVSGLNKKEISQLHNALISCNLPKTLDKFVYENLSTEAERNFKREFRLWRVELLQKLAADVVSITDVPLLGVKNYTVAPRATLPGINFHNPKYISVDPQTVLNARDDKEAAATGISYYSAMPGSRT